MAKVEEYSQYKKELAGWPVNVVTYRLGTVFHTSVENTDPGAWVVKAEGPTKQAAEAKALKDAEALLANIKTSKPPTGCTSVPGF